jgi:hypothetical protein
LLFKVDDKVRWETDKWNKAFNLINDFKDEFKLKVKNIDKTRDREIYFNLGDYILYFTENNLGLWITFETHTSKADFDEKYEFIFNRIND